MAKEQQKTRNKPKSQGISLGQIKKYLEQGYMTNWGTGYVWNENLVILRSAIPPQEHELATWTPKYNFVIISKTNTIEINSADSINIINNV